MGTQTGKMIAWTKRKTVNDNNNINQFVIDSVMVYFYITHRTKSWQDKAFHLPNPMTNG